MCEIERQRKRRKKVAVVANEKAKLENIFVLAFDQKKYFYVPQKTVTDCKLIFLLKLLISRDVIGSAGT